MKYKYKQLTLTADKSILLFHLQTLCQIYIYIIRPINISGIEIEPIKMVYQL